MFLDSLKVKDLIKISKDINKKIIGKKKNVLIEQLNNTMKDYSEEEINNIMIRLDIKYKTPIYATKLNGIKKLKLGELKYNLNRRNINYDPNDGKSKLILLLTSHIGNRASSIIQKYIRRLTVQNKKINHGLVVFNKELCNNKVDFMTYGEITDVQDMYFISYKDNDGFYYGFDIRSLNPNLNKTMDINPFNRNKIPDYVLRNIANLFRLLIKQKIDTKYKDTIKELTPSELYKNNVIDICNRIDELGYYSNVEWILNLSVNQYIKFYEHIYDIWGYRLQLTTEQKFNIIPHTGTPFNKNLHYIQSCTDITILRKYCLKVMKRLMNSSDNVENQKLGCLYVLMALTLVNNIVAQDLPWLYQSVINV